MKKILLGLLLGAGLLTLTGCFGGDNNEQEDITPIDPGSVIEILEDEIVVEGDFAYKVREDGLELIYSSKLEGDIVIPDEVDDIPVIGIGYKTFVNSGSVNGIEGTGITSLILGENIETIGDWAFTGNEIKSVTIPNSVTTIGFAAFMESGLTSVTMGDSVTTIGDYAFSGNNLTSVTIPDSVTTIGNSAFAGNGLTSVTIGDSVTTIGDSAFENNELTSVIIGTGIETIGDSAFHQNNELTSVTFMGGVIIDENSFSDSVVFYDKDNKVIWNSTEATNNVLEPKALIESLKSDFSTEEYQRDLLNNSNSGSLSKDDFVVEGDFTYMKTADGLELIHSDVREGEIVIPNKVNDIEITSIVDLAFVGVINNEMKGSGITKLTIGDNIKLIGVGAFLGNELTSVIIGTGIEIIGNAAFSGNNNLTKVTFMGGDIINETAFSSNPTFYNSENKEITSNN